MKFFFCEKCGKRLTEEQISKGEAKNKKLRGVFCTNCAAGVMTMESLPLTDEQAASVLGVKTSSDSISPAPQRRSSEQRILTASSHGSRSGESRARRPSGAPVILIVAGTAVATLVVLLLFIGKGSSSPPTRTARPSSELAPSRTPLPAKPRLMPAEPVRAASNAQPEPAESPAPEPDSPADPAKEVEIPTAPVDPQAPTTIAQGPAQEVPKPELPAAVPVEAAPADPASPAETWPWHDLITALQAENHARAQAWLDARPATAPGLEDLRAALEAREDRQTAMVATLKRRVGQPIDLLTAVGRVKGKLVEFKDGTLTVERTIIVNGETRGKFRTAVALDQVPAEVRAGFADLIALPGEAGGISRVLEALAANDLDVAGNALGDIPAHPLHTALAGLLKRTRTERLEEEARIEWERLCAEAKKPQTIAIADKHAYKLKEWEARYSSTAFAKESDRAKERDALHERLSVAGRANDARLLQLFKGRVVKFDDQTLEITLLYDFQDQRQCEDWVANWHSGGAKPGAAWKRGEVATLGTSTFERVLGIPFLRASTVSIVYNYKDLKSNSRMLVGLAYFGTGREDRGRRLAVAGTEEGWKMTDERGEQIYAPTPKVKLPPSGKVEIACKDGKYTVKQDGKLALSYACPTNGYTGVALISGWDTFKTYTSIQITGRLDPAWVKQALNASKSVEPPPNNPLKKR